MNIKNTKKPTGFTLIELLVAMVVAGILLGVALPSFKTLLDKMAVRTTANTIVEAVRSARVSAVEERSKMRVCGLSTNGECGAADADWDRGLVILRVNDDDTTETVHSIRFKESVYITIRQAADYRVHINEQGWSPGSANSILVCQEPGNNEYGYRVVISRAGKIRLEYSEDNTGWKAGDGTDLTC